MNRTQRRTLKNIFEVPTRANIRFADVEKLIVGLGGKILEGRGSRIAFEIERRRLFLHRPHPAKNALKYQIEALREFLATAGIDYE